MNRDAAIEAGARALFESRTSRPWEAAVDDRIDVRGIWRREAAAVIDAVLPHLAPRPEQVVKAEALREWAAETRAAYPELIFIPPTPERLRQVHEFCKQSGGTLDAISAHIMRHAARIADDDADRIERGEP